MRKLVIGCGYLGRRVAEKWIEQEHQVWALTRSPGHADDLRRAGIHPVIGDVTVPETLAALPDAETVVYAVGYDRDSGKSRREIYVDGLANVLNEIAPRVGRFLYISSTSVYGQSGGEWVDESSPCEPARSNGQVCLEAEHLVRGAFPAAQDPGQRGATVLRLSGLYGPGRLLRRIASLRAAEVLPGHPESYLNLIHVDDAVQSVLACEDRGRPGAIYLVSDDRPIRRREYYGTLASLVGAPPPRFAENDQPEGTARSLNKRCANGRIREELGVSLRFPTIESGLPHALDGTG